MGQLAQVDAPLGPRIRVARENAGMSLEDLARRLGVEVASLQAWENDERAPRANRLAMMSGVLDVSLSWLLEGREDRHMAAPSEVSVIGLHEDLEHIAGLLANAQQALDALRERVAALEREASSGG